MFKRDIKKQNALIQQVEKLWENDHGEEMTKAYNEIIGILGKLDMYSANILVNLLWLQAVQKTYIKTVGKEEVEING
jgi:hypothetical protein